VIAAASADVIGRLPRAGMVRSSSPPSSLVDKPDLGSTVKRCAIVSPAPQNSEGPVRWAQVFRKAMDAHSSLEDVVGHKPCQSFRQVVAELHLVIGWTR
jgi:hypothetical protein